jgi:RAB proteins geranylgeranyltransferase component A (RAB escort protein)
MNWMKKDLSKKGYDVILCGTGLTQSIVAAALARAGKSILHCDSNEFYGDLDAVHSLGSLREWNSKVVANRTSCEKYHGDDEDDEKGQETSPGHFISLESSECYSSLTINSESNVMSDYYNHAISWEKGMKVETQYGVGTLLATAPTTEQHDRPIESLPVELDDWILANGTRAVVYIGRKNQKMTQSSWDLVPYDAILYREYVSLSWTLPQGSSWQMGRQWMELSRVVSTNIANSRVFWGCICLRLLLNKKVERNHLVVGKKSGTMNKFQLCTECLVRNVMSSKPSCCRPWTNVVS